jgi:hypothetical protein
MILRRANDFLFDEGEAVARVMQREVINGRQVP